MKISADVLIVTVNNIEAGAVLKEFESATGTKAVIFNGTTNTYHDLGMINGQHAVMVQSGMGSVGLGASLQTVTEAVAELHPSAVIMAGVAFGAKKDKQDIGDVLIANRIMSYEPQRVGTKEGMEEITSRGSKVDVSQKLLGHLRAIDVRRGKQSPNISIGTILSGEKLVDNAAFVEKLKGIEPEAIGGEMEGAGLYAACQQAKVDWILVKGICDWGDGNKNIPDKDKHQTLAAENAVAFIVEALKAGQLVVPKKAQYSTAESVSGSNSKKSRVTITIRGTLEQFDKKRQEEFVAENARLADVPEEDVELVLIREGSIVIVLLMPTTGAMRLLTLWKSKQYTLMDLRFEQMNVEPWQEELPEKIRLKESTSEAGIVEALSSSHMYRERPKSAFQSGSMLDIDLLSEFIQTTQPKEWAKLAKQFPGEESAVLAAQVSSLTAKRGTLAVLRNGVSFNGVNLQLTYFKPSGTGNPEHRSKYESNVFSIMRQVHFSVRTPDQSVDMVIFLNGLPIISIELKNHFTGQNVQHAIAQYRRRDSREVFFQRCFVHLALDDDAVYMSTKLEGRETMFLPFNRDVKNPIIYSHFASSYLWSDFKDTDGQVETGVLKADSLLELIQNYLHFERDEKSGKEKFVFPRFHQLMAVRKILAHARTNGSGHNYLIQHSAGSGKSNSIAWLTHQLANLSGMDGRPVFDSIIVITDRRVLDRQLQDTIKQFEKIKGTVTKIDRNTKQLVRALERGDKIIITTLQKFGFVGELAKLPGKTFAVVVDEAHSSQSGENVKDLKIVLTSEEQLKSALDKDTEGQDENPMEAELEMIQKARQKLPHLSFFAFTATPKDKTLELFGTPDPSVKKGFRPFHQYTMRQAIAEGFILDVLQSYTTYKTYFELLENEKADGEKLVEELKARRLLLEYVDRHAYAIRRKSYIIVDHFTRKTAFKIGAQAKAMVVTHSRAHAVLYKQAIDEVVREQNLPFGVLVAFSGTVTINEKKYTEENMNPPGTGDIAEAFKSPMQRLLIVANKFQTGFDQPLLHTMYVDKKLGGVAAVQTLSRLNRIYPPLKQDTMILDFVNEQEVIQASFQDYYQRTELEGATDPNKLYNLRYTLEQMRVFTMEDVEKFAELFIAQKATAEKLQPFFQQIVENGYAQLGSEHRGTPEFEKKASEARDKFRKELSRYTRQYSFISQIMTFTDPALEKFYLFAKLLAKQLPFERLTLPREIMDMVDMEKFRVQEEQNGSIILAEEDAALGIVSDDGHRGGGEELKERLQIIVRRLNEDYHIAFEEADRVVNAIKGKLESDDALRAAFMTNSVEFLRKQKLQDSIKEAFLSNADEFLNFMSKTETDPGFGKFFFAEMFRWYTDSVVRKQPPSKDE